MKKKWMELGRSMVEMLGVLAVIGVLSIVGLAGYKKAINKIHANELMDIAMKVYNQNLAYAVVHPSSVQTDVSSSTMCSNSVPTSGSNISSTIATACNKRNLAISQPSWNTSKDFSIRSILKNSVADSHLLILTGLEDCDICDELQSMTEEVAGEQYRRLPGSISPELANGILVMCRKGAASNQSCW